jgi:hypothetical protein
MRAQVQVFPAIEMTSSIRLLRLAVALLLGRARTQFHYTRLGLHSDRFGSMVGVCSVLNSIGTYSVLLAFFDSVRQAYHDMVEYSTIS